MNFELTGKLIEKFDEVQISDKFKKRDFVVEKTENNFTEQIKFQSVQDKTSLVESFNIGDEIKVHFNIKGNKWKDNYFVNLQAWRIEGSAGDTPMQDTPPTFTEEDMPPPPAEADDLPF